MFYFESDTSIIQAERPIGDFYLEKVDGSDWTRITMVSFDILISNRKQSLIIWISYISILFWKEQGIHSIEIHYHIIIKDIIYQILHLVFFLKIIVQKFIKTFNNLKQILANYLKINSLFTCTPYISQLGLPRSHTYIHK